MKTMIRTIALAALLSTVAACSKRRPADLPPAPPVAGTDGSGSQLPGSIDPTGVDPGTVGSVPLTGQQAAFLQAVRSDRVLFATDSYTLDAEARAILDNQAAWLSRNPAAAITVEGHADERGTREYNLALGDRRANAARNYLEARGIAASRMTTVSWGKERPAVEGSSEAAWARNRRAVTVLPQ